MVYQAMHTVCPDCGTGMREDRVEGGHRFEICDGCGGMWMELRPFLDALAALQPRLATDELLLHDDGSPRRPCPVCGASMAIAWVELIQLDQCREHGVWFDRGELVRALRGDAMPAAVRAAIARVPKKRR